ncbi:hypothetical protein BO94DRAFT_614360 [Aspergillus sclerotioniger CBS 115572]|uniref:Uncharacterized protein n=1 Tax=Aspergillus sclerotioniger CBS 115572 TaxID=1450535 RepID=A0A317UV37_9EURO|nr:hypothetical protein BO94DRAFT_614360 [Aspergillus sclerotioniger CBS 115572]PWY65286.1 hypothetical protein BO94DRAFT_614360 [Aspergillus sclerotioniger CBS 115572]
MNGLPGDILRWFGEDNDLDLALDKKPTHFTDSTTKAPYRKKSYFRRTLSLNSARFTRSQALAVSQSPTTPSFLANILTRDLRSRPLSSKTQSHHVTPSTSGSIDPCAQYYQNPEARLKLRLYLASPHNFDEAIELGFPAPGVRDVALDQQSSPKHNPKSRRATIMPSEVGQNANLGTSRDHISGLVQASCVLRHSVSCNDLPLDDGQQTSTINPKVDLQQKLGKREMTLKMTLTRPDLRTNSWIDIPPVIDTPGAIEATKPPSADIDSQLRDSDEEKRSRIKDVWYKLQIWK